MAEARVDKLYCHRDQLRECGPDCMAHLTTPPEGATYVGEAWPRCLELVSQERVARHLVIIAGQIGRQDK